jgi:hypothetical protein
LVAEAAFDLRYSFSMTVWLWSYGWSVTEGLEHAALAAISSVTGVDPLVIATVMAGLALRIFDAVYPPEKNS